MGEDRSRCIYTTIVHLCISLVYLSTEAACLGDAVHPVEAGLGGHQQEVVAAADEVVPGHLDICMELSQKGVNRISQ